MALKNPKRFGLNVFSALADVVDKEQSLNSLNLYTRDLDIIRGSKNAGASSGDWISFSRLTDPIYRTLDRYITDHQEYESILGGRAGTERTLFGNLNINGILSGNAVRYRYLDGTGVGATVKIADISTSRVSAWSSSASPVTSTSPISYGAQVSVRSGGALQFGTQSGTTGPRLQTSLIPEVKEFASEFPTSKITCNIGGQSVVLYAMKGIPLIFKGFFRNLNASIRLTSLINNTAANWKIVEVADSSKFTRFINQGSVTSSINFRSSISRERYIQFYYNPDNISGITMTSANISELPAVKLQNVIELNFSSNQLRNFPDFTFISPTPTLQILNLINNPLSQSETENERKLNSNILSKIPTTLRQLYLGETFFGSIPQNIIANRFTNLTVLHLSRTSENRPYFHPDTDDANCQLPNVPNTCETYSVSSNDFRSFGLSAETETAKSVLNLTNLISLDVSLNHNLSVNESFSIANGNNVIQSIVSHYTNLPLPTGLSGKNSFTTLYHFWCRNAGPLIVGGNYLYDNCNSLSTLHLYASNVTGRFPKFTNAALSYLDLRLTNLTGGGPDDNEEFVIPRTTFENCVNLVYLLIQSPLLLTSSIDSSILIYSPNLYYFWYISYGRTTGNIPDLSLNSNLHFLVLHWNNFTGNMPNFVSNPNIYYVNISYNALSGSIPPLKNLQNLNRLLVNNNQFTSLSTFSNLQNLQFVYAQSNKLSGEIPSFSECPNILYIILFNNLLTDYKTGALATNYRLSYLDLSGNLLTGQAVNQIIADLLLNYNTVNRGGVTVNLRGGNALPSGVALESIDILRSKGWSIVYN